MLLFKCLVFASAVVPAVRCVQAPSRSDQQPLGAAPGLSVYMEMASLDSSELAPIESQLLKKYSSGQNTYRLSEEARITQDDAFKSLVMNALGPQMDAGHDFCTKNAPCIQSFVRNPAFSANMFSVLGRHYAEAQAQGCLQIGGCRAEVLGTLNWHVEHAHNVLVESGMKDSKGIQERLTIINRNPSYQKVLVVAAHNYQAMAAKRADTAAMSTTIMSFLADPKSNSAPLLTDPKNFSLAVQEFTCTMHQMLECMPNEAASIGGRRCEPKFDGVFVVDRTRKQKDGSEKIHIAMKGCPRNDPGLLSARAALQSSLPPGSTMCIPTHGMPGMVTAQSLFAGLFR